MATILATVGLFVLAGAYAAFGLKIARHLVQGWTWLYTLGLPREVRDRRREEIAADVEAQCQDRDYAPKEIATQLLVRVIFGMPADVVWSGQARVHDGLRLRPRTPAPADSVRGTHVYSWPQGDSEYWQRLNGVWWSTARTQDEHQRELDANYRLLYGKPPGRQ